MQSSAGTKGRPRPWRLWIPHNRACAKIARRKPATGISPQGELVNPSSQNLCISKTSSIKQNRGSRRAICQERTASPEDIIRLIWKPCLPRLLFGFQLIYNATTAHARPARTNHRGALPARRRQRDRGREWDLRTASPTHRAESQAIWHRHRAAAEEDGQTYMSE
jgi:hypothetical protein